MATPIEEVRAMLDRIDPDSGFEEIAYHLSVMQKIERGLEDADAGRFVDESEVRDRVEACLSEDAGPLPRPTTSQAS
ncbi:MAG: hypothetical protein AAF532_02635 [Planctomycetota bacterium]